MRLASVAVALLGLGPAAPAGQQTHPHVSPRHGGAHTTFTVAFTARQTTTTHDTTVDSSYEVIAVRRGTTPTQCSSSAARAAAAATAGHKLSVRLHPATRWCTGTYTATVMLDRRVDCTPATPGTPVACPQIAFAPQDTGHTTFTVR